MWKGLNAEPRVQSVTAYQHTQNSQRDLSTSTPLNQRKTQKMQWVKEYHQDLASEAFAQQTEFPGSAKNMQQCIQTRILYWSLQSPQLEIVDSFANSWVV